MDEIEPEIDTRTVEKEYRMYRFGMRDIVGEGCSVEYSSRRAETIITVNVDAADATYEFFVEGAEMKCWDIPANESGRIHIVVDGATVEECGFCEFEIERYVTMSEPVITVEEGEVSVKLVTD